MSDQFGSSTGSGSPVTKNEITDEVIKRAAAGNLRLLAQALSEGSVEVHKVGIAGTQLGNEEFFFACTQSVIPAAKRVAVMADECLGMALQIEADLAQEKAISREVTEGRIKPIRPPIAKGDRIRVPRQKRAVTSATAGSDGLFSSTWMLAGVGVLVVLILAALNIINLPMM